MLKIKIYKKAEIPGFPSEAGNQLTKSQGSFHPLDVFRDRFENECDLLLKWVSHFHFLSKKKKKKTKQEGEGKKKHSPS